jgi:hypothetical protein
MVKMETYKSVINTGEKIIKPLGARWQEKA